MKTIKVVTLAILVSAVTFVACQKDEDTVTPETQVAEAVKPAQAISYEKARVLQKEYIETRANVLNKALQSRGVIQGEDVRDYYYDLEVLEQYIAYFKAEAKKKGYDNLGLRIHLGAYPNQEHYNEPGNSTIFIMPTHKLEDKNKRLLLNSDVLNAEGIDALNLATGGRPPVDLE
ncbi:hypothetical protein [uncultured Tenacibaculum sp.]|uniref:hypothetical protein n=1 Tax=uncultured Tenacibaculum sp. TaxID=174713 RepID=UPI002620F12E|nr:hypothetical protein [uncultured Tenacibaculum sp.]